MLDLTKVETYLHFQILRCNKMHLNQVFITGLGQASQPVQLPRVQDEVLRELLGGADVVQPQDVLHGGQGRQSPPRHDCWVSSCTEGAE